MELMGFLVIAPKKKQYKYNYNHNFPVPPVPIEHQKKSNVL
jgi:hypothetical protein